ncbi:MAG TPA: 5'-nucleotidase C-terminal domain-containing protein [Gammaproteobacteria bacterium]|nr:5'-nucleotidase C-terminal domain-containing protein [Gammaproteobacteria bacterium]
MRRTAVLALGLAALAGVALAAFVATPRANPTVTLSIVGTTDLHGNVFGRDGRGGLALLGGYLHNLRAARAADGGAVVLIDSGDTYQAGIESDLSEGAIVVDAYNALGVTAAAIGNHEFDFGPVDDAGAHQRLDTDPRGALQARAAQARFAYLAANLIDDSTGEPVHWPNVRPSVLLDVAGVKVGLIGIMTIDALRATLAANVHGLHVAPLAPVVEAEARKLRAAGAAVVIVGAHAGGACAEFRDPKDLSSCDDESEIFRLARALPAGLVDVIAAGHTHQGLAHEVAGIAIVQAYSHGRAFGRADVVVDRRAQRVLGHALFAPRDVCARQDPATLLCGGADLPAASYEGRVVAPSAAIEAAMAPALARVRSLQSQPLGVVLDAPISRAGDLESALGNLFADALREESGADVAINNNLRGGLRADLPAGPLTFGSLYDVFPFDNRLLTVSVSGAQLKLALANEVRRNRRGALGISGVHVLVRCTERGLDVELRRPSGRLVGADERLSVAVLESLVQRGTFAPAIDGANVDVPQDAPVMREMVERWLRGRGGRLSADEFLARPRWEYADPGPLACSTQ